MAAIRPRTPWLTPQERWALAFILALLVIGGIIYQVRFAPVDKGEPTVTGQSHLTTNEPWPNPLFLKS